jgi:hypothetical protein
MMMKIKKFNWGTGIVISIAIFMIITIMMMITFMNQKVDLVTENYYEKTIDYQDQIDINNRTLNLEETVNVTCNQNVINISFPKTFFKDVKNGKLFFYRPSDSNEDFEMALNLDDNGNQVFSASKMLKGFWKIGINWNMNKQNYQTEKSIIIN